MNPNSLVLLLTRKTGKNMKKIFVTMTVIVAGLIFITGCDKKADTSTVAPEPATTHTEHTTHTENTAPAEATPETEPAAATTSDSVEQTVCPVMGDNPIDKNLFVDYQGKRVYFCCEYCVGEFKKSPEKYLAKLPQFGAK